MATLALLTPSVLLVNDAPGERESYARALRASGYQAIEAATFTAAYRIATARPFDIVVTDVHIAGSISGLELTRRLRNDTRTSAVPIIVLTTMSRPQDGDIAIKAGADTFLEKPVPVPVLKAAIVRLLPVSRRLLRQSVPQRQRSIRLPRQIEPLTAADSAKPSAHLSDPIEGPAQMLRRPVEPGPRISTDGRCPSCGAALVYRDRWPFLAAEVAPEVDGDRRERIRYKAAWFCTEPSCDYFELS